MTVVCNPNPIDSQGLLDGPPSPLNDDQVSTTAKLLVDCRCHLGEVSIFSTESFNNIILVFILDVFSDTFFVSLLLFQLFVNSVFYMMIDKMQSSLRVY